MLNAWYFTHTNTSLNFNTTFHYDKPIYIKKLFTEKEITDLVRDFGFKRMGNEEIVYTLQSAFSDYIIGALSEMSGDPQNDQQLYIEAGYHLNKASKLLEGMPHPAGKMSFRLGNMIGTLKQLLRKVFSQGFSG